MVSDKTLSITTSSLDFWLTCRYRGNIHSVGPLPGSWLAACMADLTPDLKVYLSWGSIAKSFHSLQSLSVISSMSSWASQGHAFHQPVHLDWPLEHSTCPYQRSLLSFRMRSRSSMSSYLYKTTTFPHQPLRSISKVVL